ncbi:hypothetical protein KY362_03360 [Candidatus Woesearchaeota archaeon]|nr:hypothetical protein [Candidatus Woesearchaeota archaeon]
MAKISIHIPDEVLEKVRQHKDSLNISKVCSAALLREVEIIADVPALVDETRKLLTRLRDNLHARQKESFDLGVSLAQAYLSKASHDQLQYWGSLVFSERKRLVFPEDVEDYLERHSLKKDARPGPSLHRPSFTKGWLAVMQRTWATVKDRI